MLTTTAPPIKRYVPAELEFLLQDVPSITGDRARAILKNCFFKPQEMRTGSQYLDDGTLRETVKGKMAQRRIARMVHMMRDPHVWMPEGHHIHFACPPTGELVLVNGYHRVYSALEIDTGVRIAVTIVDVLGEADVSRLYNTYDTAGVTAQRGGRQVLAAADFASNHGISRQVASAMWAAAPLIAKGFSTNPADSDALMAVPDVRIQFMMGYLSAGRLLTQLMQRNRGLLSQRLTIAGPAAVALVTLNEQPSKAIEFWSLVLANDGLRRGSPEHTYVQFLTNRSTNIGLQHTSYAAAAAAWNAFFKGRTLKLIKVLDTDRVRILGTEFA